MNSGTAYFQFTIELLGPSGSPVTVAYATANGTATTSNKDYKAISGALTFSPGATIINFSVPVIGDTKVESDEDFFVNLSNATNAIIVNSQGVGTIQNDDGLSRWQRIRGEFKRSQG